MVVGTDQHIRARTRGRRPARPCAACRGPGRGRGRRGSRGACRAARCRRSRAGSARTRRRWCCAGRCNVLGCGVSVGRRSRTRTEHKSGSHSSECVWHWQRTQRAKAPPPRGSHRKPGAHSWHCAPTKPSGHSTQSAGVCEGACALAEPSTTTSRKPTSPGAYVPRSFSPVTLARMLWKSNGSMSGFHWNAASSCRRKRYSCFNVADMCLELGFPRA